MGRESTIKESTVIDEDIKDQTLQDRRVHSSKSVINEGPMEIIGTLRKLIEGNEQPQRISNSADHVETHEKKEGSKITYMHLVSIEHGVGIEFK